MNGRVVYGGWLVSRIRMPAHSVMMSMGLLGFVQDHRQYSEVHVVYKLQSLLRLTSLFYQLKNEHSSLTPCKKKLCKDERTAHM